MTTALAFDDYLRAGGINKAQKVCSRCRGSLFFLNDTLLCPTCIAQQSEKAAYGDCKPPSEELKTLLREYDSIEGALDHIVDDVASSLAESNIERLLHAALRLKFKRVDWLEGPLTQQGYILLGNNFSQIVCFQGLSEREIGEICNENKLTVIFEQFKTSPYRLDFAVFVGKKRGGFSKIAIECDGHDYRDKTKEQARRDRQRDRHLLINDWKVLRFTGSEVWFNPKDCAEEIAEFIDKERYSA